MDFLLILLIIIVILSTNIKAQSLTFKIYQIIMLKSSQRVFSVEITYISCVVYNTYIEGKNILTYTKQAQIKTLS